MEQYLTARGWPLAYLSSRAGLSVKQIHALLAEYTPVTADSAKQLAQTFHTSPDFWLKLDARYRLFLRLSSMDS